MGIFRRRRRDAETTPAPEQPAAGDPVAVPESQVEAESGPAQPQAPAVGLDALAGAGSVGPFDVSEVDAQDGYIDLGSLWIPAVPGLMLTVEVDPESDDITGLRLHVTESVLQVQAFAAPKTSGIWEEIRAEIAESIGAQGGSADESTGRLGAELLARLPGRDATTTMRFLGFDGPRWFLRGVISGPAATDEALAAQLVDLMRLIVVVRGDQPMAPRELLPLHLPEEPVPATDADLPTDQGAGSTDDLQPFERGPEITEIR